MRRATVYALGLAALLCGTQVASSLAAPQAAGRNTCIQGLPEGNAVPHQAGIATKPRETPVLTLVAGCPNEQPG